MEVAFQSVHYALEIEQIVFNIAFLPRYKKEAALQECRELHGFCFPPGVSSCRQMQNK